MNQKRYVIGDIHGSYKGLKQCLSAVDFDYKNDLLICLGDTVDGYPEVKECFDELLKIKNLIYCLGNHDEWALNWMLYGAHQKIWLKQGGMATIASYGSLNNAPSGHAELLSKAYLYYELDNMLFVHGGADVNQADIKKQTTNTLLWDRQLIQTAYKKDRLGRDWKALDYDTIFVGHTTTRMFKRGGDYVEKPLQVCNVIDMDTGAGWAGKLSIMNIDTKEYWQSDYSKDLYPECEGRR